MPKKVDLIWAEMARRKLQFHPRTDWFRIEMWGLFQWGEVSALLKMGLLRTRMEKRNRTIWVYPSQYAYDNYIKPLLALSIPELEVLAGWRKQHPLDHQATLASLN